ncbi:MAG: rhomboid family intramembrane serine protease [Myxococcales bacterium]|nr:MAG: rhomboid family intramembrane serine protease [Myxococcales bacterium]
MIPLKDRNPTRSKPLLTWALIAANVAVFIYQVSLGPHGMELVVRRWGMVPYFLTQEFYLESLLRPFTSMFMHGGWLHLIGNMWFLHIFGDNVEDRSGKKRFIWFYLLCGLAAVVAQTAIEPGSKVPMVGASGAISGVLAAYVSLFPGARIFTVVPIFIFIQFIEIPAFFFIFVWFALQLLGGHSALAQAGSSMGGVAFFAHIGGFVAGLMLTPLFRQAKRARRRP